MDAPALTAIPLEVYHRIVLCLLDHAPLGPPAALLPLLLTSHAVKQRTLSIPLLADVFRTRFDLSAPARRVFAGPVLSPSLAHQLRVWSHTLNRIKHADTRDRDLLPAFEHALAMLLEDDGRNRAQLIWAGLPTLVDRFVRTRMRWTHVGTQRMLWPDENRVNAVALWLMWMTLDRERLHAMSEDERNQLVDVILPFVIVPFRYPAAHAPPHHFTLPLPVPTATATASRPTLPTHSLLTAHGPYPVYRLPAPHSVCLGSAYAVPPNHPYHTRTHISPPLATTAAKLIYFALRAVVPFGIPPHLPPTRADAVRTGRALTGPTQEDILEFNNGVTTRLPPPAHWDWARATHTDYAREAAARVPVGHERAPSAAWDCDWERLRRCADVSNLSSEAHYLAADVPGAARVPYVPGTLTGLWQGRMVIPSELPYRALVGTRHMPPDFGETHFFLTTVPVYMRIREHHCRAPRAPAPCGGGADVPGTGGAWGGEELDEGARNAWFPERTLFVEREAGFLDVKVPVATHVGPAPDAVPLADGHYTYRYETWVREGKAGGGVLRGDDAGHDAGRCPRCVAAAAREDAARRARVRRADAAAVRGLAVSGGVRVREEIVVEEEEVRGGEACGVTGEHEGVFAAAGLGREACAGIVDIVFTGETDARHGAAWNHFTFYGRVRRWDGLVGILRVARDARLGNLFFFGYVVGGRNFVGNWRVADARAAGGPVWESAFSMSKREEGEE